MYLKSKSNQSPSKKMSRSI